MKIVTNYSQLTTFQYIAKIEEIIAPLKKLGIDYFCYSECTKDGMLRGLMNKGEFCEYYLKNKFERFDIMAINHFTPKMMPAGLYLWDMIDAPGFHEFLAMARSFGIHHGCTIVEMDDNIKRSYNFATGKQENYYITNVYINKFHLLKAFIKYFLETAARLIDNSNWYKFTIPVDESLNSLQLSSSLPEDLEKDFLREMNVHQYEGILKMQKLTPRELQCLELIVAGKCVKEIARALNLSVRTIDAYIRELKSKMGCHKTTELIIKILKNQMIIGQKS